jgi:hypothetical protein
MNKSEAKLNLTSELEAELSKRLDAYLDGKMKFKSLEVVKNSIHSRTQELKKRPHNP